MTPYDIAGIGIGPFNLGLAALLSSHPEMSGVFLERKPSFRWHEGLILPGTTLQVPFMADLVTMVEPTHPLSFLNYLAAHDRLYRFYFYENFMIPREEYDHYCRWASQRLPSCRFGEPVADVTYSRDTQRFTVETKTEAGKMRRYEARNIALGIGTVPHLPQWARRETRAPLLHSSEFGKRRQELSKRRRVTVVGSGQSAAECVLALFSDLTPEAVAAGFSIHWITRSPGFFPMEYSKLGLEYFTPDYMRHFHRLGAEQRRQVVAGQDLLHKGISFSTIGEIFDLLYHRSAAGRNPGLTLTSNCAVETLEDTPLGFRLGIRHKDLGEGGFLETDAVIAATGYRHQWPAWLDAFKGEVLATDPKGDLIVGDDFRAARADDGAGAVFVQNAETFHHGVGSPDLGLGAFRNATIINQLLGRERYRVRSNVAFQNFGLPQDADSGAETTGESYERAF